MKTYFKTASASTLALLAGAMPAQAQDFTFTPIGRVFFDYAVADGQNSNLDLNASELRRARLGGKGSFGNNVSYKIEFNTNSGGAVELTDGYVAFKPGGGKWEIKAGHFKPATALDEETSSKYSSVIERAAFTDAFGFERRIGVAVRGTGDNYLVEAGAFSVNAHSLGDQEGTAFAARAVYLPINTDETKLHLGLSTMHRDQNDSDAIRYRQRPFTHIPGRIISTGNFAKKDSYFGSEIAVINKNLWAAGEYVMTKADAANSGGVNNDATFTGGYAEVGAVFGGTKGYKLGELKGVKIDNPITQGGYGALSIVARYDTLDLTDEAVNGGALDTVVLGADWWPTKGTRWSVNYFSADADLGTVTSGLDSEIAALVRNPLVTTESVSGFVTRLYVYF